MSNHEHSKPTSENYQALFDLQPLINITTIIKILCKTFYRYKIQTAQNVYPIQDSEISCISIIYICEFHTFYLIPNIYPHMLFIYIITLEAFFKNKFQTLAHTWSNNGFNLHSPYPFPWIRRLQYPLPLVVIVTLSSRHPYWILSKYRMSVT